MQIKRAVAWRIVIFDLILVTLLILFFSNYVFDYLWMLILQFFIVVVVLRKSFWAARIDSDEKKELTNWAWIGILAGLIPGLIIFVIWLVGNSKPESAFLSALPFFAGIICGVIGAYKGRYSKKSVWVAAGLGAILGEVCLFFLFFLFVTFTCCQ